MEPARSIIAKFATTRDGKTVNGEGEVSRITGTAYTAPYRWQHPKDKGGTGGQIPQKHIPILLAHAKINGIALAIEDFYAAVEAAVA